MTFPLAFMLPDRTAPVPAPSLPERLKLPLEFTLSEQVTSGPAEHWPMLPLPSTENVTVTPLPETL